MVCVGSGAEKQRNPAVERAAGKDRRRLPGGDGLGSAGTRSVSGWPQRVHAVLFPESLWNVVRTSNRVLERNTSFLHSAEQVRAPAFQSEVQDHVLRTVSANPVRTYRGAEQETEGDETGSFGGVLPRFPALAAGGAPPHDLQLGGRWILPRLAFLQKSNLEMNIQIQVVCVGSVSGKYWWRGGWGGWGRERSPRRKLRSFPF